jgi:uncharacterized protein (TIGR02145 family)
MTANLNYNPNTGKSKCYAEHNQHPEPPWLTPEAAKPNCDKYGRLYDWATAMGLSASCNTSSCASQIQKQHKGICPSNWHIPSKEDWETLKKFIEEEIFDNWEDVDFGWDVGTKLKALAINGRDTAWKANSTTDYGVDSYGFGAIGSGYCVSCEELSSAAGFYSGLKEEAHWWSSTEYTDLSTAPKPHGTKAYKSKITYNKKVMTLETEKKADYLYSVRCVKN